MGCPSQELPSIYHSTSYWCLILFHSFFVLVVSHPHWPEIEEVHMLYCMGVTLVKKKKKKPFLMCFCNPLWEYKCSVTALFYPYDCASFMLPVMRLQAGLSWMATLHLCLPWTIKQTQVSRNPKAYFKTITITDIYFISQSCNTWHLFIERSQRFCKALLTVTYMHDML